VIGDQPDRDIAPARAAGCRAVLVPSRFRPEWHDDAAWRNADRVSDTFDAAVEWVVSDLSRDATLNAVVHEDQAIPSDAPDGPRKVRQCGLAGCWDEGAF